MYTRTLLRHNVLRTARTPAAALTARCFATSPIVNKSAVDSAKDTIKQADRKVSDAAVRGIEKGRMYRGFHLDPPLRPSPSSEHPRRRLSTRTDTLPSRCVSSARESYTNIRTQNKPSAPPKPKQPTKPKTPKPPPAMLQAKHKQRPPEPRKSLCKKQTKAPRSSELVPA